MIIYSKDISFRLHVIFNTLCNFVFLFFCARKIRNVFVKKYFTFYLDLVYPCRESSPDITNDSESCLEITETKSLAPTVGTMKRVCLASRFQSSSPPALLPRPPKLIKVIFCQLFDCCLNPTYITTVTWCPTGPIRSFTVMENHIGSVVSNNLWYIDTNRHPVPFI